jgi:hypothetical protein
MMPPVFILNSLFLFTGFFNLKKENDFIRYCVFIGITFINKFYKFSTDTHPAEDKDFIVMSYNVRLFNLFNWSIRMMCLSDC